MKYIKKILYILHFIKKFMIMIIYLLIDIIISMDTGLFTSASTIIKESLKIDDKKFGLFRSIPINVQGP